MLWRHELQARVSTFTRVSRTYYSSPLNFLWSLLVRIFLETSGLQKINIEIVLSRGFCLFSCSNFTFTWLSSQKVENNSTDFWTCAQKKIYWQTIKTIECLCLRSIGLIVALWKFDVLKTSIFALEALLLTQATTCICFKIINFPQGNYQPIVPITTLSFK